MRFAANAYLTLQARADARLSVSTRRPRVGRSFTISGQLQGVSRGGVTVIVQGRAARLAPLRDVRRHDDVEQRHASASATASATRGSRGRRFVFRARIRPAERFPYETGYSQTVTVQRALRSRLPSVYGHGGRER